MKRPWGPMLAVFVLAGCRTPAQPNDPFLYRSTIPPPGTLTAPGAAGVPQPYYPSTGTPAAIPGPAPPLVSPGVVAPPPQPAPIPVSPVPTGPVGPAAPPNNYSPPGGFSFPQSSSPLPTPPTNQPAAAPASGSSPQPATDTGVISASAWQQLPNKLAANAPPGSAPRPEPSVIRIIEPPAKPATTNAANADVAIVSPGTPLSAPAHPAAVVSTTPTTAATIPATSAAEPEITDLRVPGNSTSPTASHVAAAGPLPRSTNYPPLAAGAAAAVGAAISLPGDQPGAAYGYDAGYKNIRGKLEYSVNDGVWRLRYLPPGMTGDAHGGIVTIADARQLSGFEAGDFVAIQGTISPAPAAGLPATLAVDRIRRQ